jgi:hypothetical protein
MDDLLRPVRSLTAGNLKIVIGISWRPVRTKRVHIRLQSSVRKPGNQRVFQYFLPPPLLQVISRGLRHLLGLHFYDPRIEAREGTSQ